MNFITGSQSSQTAPEIRTFMKMKTMADHISRIPRTTFHLDLLHLASHLDSPPAFISMKTLSFIDKRILLKIDRHCWANSLTV